MYNNGSSGLHCFHVVCRDESSFFTVTTTVYRLQIQVWCHLKMLQRHKGLRSRFLFSVSPEEWGTNGEGCDIPSGTKRKAGLTVTGKCSFSFRPFFFFFSILYFSAHVFFLFSFFSSSFLHPLLSCFSYLLFFSLVVGLPECGCAVNDSGLVADVIVSLRKISLVSMRLTNGVDWQPGGDLGRITIVPPRVGIRRWSWETGMRRSWLCLLVGHGR